MENHFPKISLSSESPKRYLKLHASMFLISVLYFLGLQKGSNPIVELLILKRKLTSILLPSSLVKLVLAFDVCFRLKTFQLLTKKKKLFDNAKHF
jgi:hypothetical protein